MKRREFIAGVGAAIAASVPGRAQPARAPVIGLLNAISLGPNSHLIVVLRRALAEAGYVEGRNLTIEYRWGEGRYQELPAMAADLVRRRVELIIATPTVSAIAASKASSTIPIVFSGTDDPVKLGLVASLARPGGNATGVHFFLSALASKQLGILRELMPEAVHFGVLVNPNNPNAASVMDEAQQTAAQLGVRITFAHAKDQRELAASFAQFSREKVQALVIAADPFFFGRRVQLAVLTARYALPAIHNVREYAEVGCLISYGTNLTEVFHQVGVYAGRILNGAKPADLPVVQSTKFELVINAATANALGVTLPPTLLARADEVIE